MAELTIGLISGTSMDGLDVALCDCSQTIPQVISSSTYPIPDDLVSRLHHFAQGNPMTANAIGLMNREFSLTGADAVTTLLNRAGLKAEQIRALGWHGQTVWHAPDENPAHTWQLGDPATLAAHCGIDVIADFRSMDMALGGQGAPLAPLAHAAWLGRDQQTVAVLNLGGIANVSILRGKLIDQGFDTGPANTMLDAWVQQHHGLKFDRDGNWAAEGEIHEGLLQAMLDDAYFQKPPPKSTGPEYFNLAWLSQFPESRRLPAEDVQATLTQLTVQSVYAALPSDLDQLWVCGGGVHNPLLMAGLRSLMQCPVDSTEIAGMDPDHIESCLFAWLAFAHKQGMAMDLPAVTGASQAAVLGAHYPKP